MRTNKKPIDLELLTSIQAVEVSPFLFTRIQQRIQNATQPTISTTWTWAIAVLFLCLLTLNIGLIRGQYIQNDLPQVATTIDFIPNHNLYNE